GAPVEFTPKQRERMDVDVRARVLWGDPPDAIQEDWLKKGAPAAEVAGALKAAMSERVRHFRVRGVQDLALAIGAFLAAAGAAGLYWAFRQGWIALYGRVIGYLVVSMAVFPCVGLVFGFRGFRRLTGGGEQTEAASD